MSTNHKPGRNRKGVQTEWGQRNADFCAARRFARAGQVEKMNGAIALMAKVQPLSKREQEAISRNLPERRQPAPRER